MTSLWKTFIAIFFLLLHFQSMADTEKIIEFENQREEIFELENWLKEITYTQEQVESTCYRTEYETENVCRNVTRYRQECHTVPAHQECRQVNDPICSTETHYERECRNEPGEEQCRVVVRYRRECSSGRGERQCHTVPGDIQCRVINGENRCTKIPPREVCEERPGREECRDVPYEERECRPGPSRFECRDVPRYERVCRDNYRQVCETVPAQRVCDQVPYQVEECKDEQVPYQVPYSCMRTVQVPHEKILKTHKAQVQVLFDAKAAQANSTFKVTLNDKGSLSFGAQKIADDVLAFLKKEVKTESVGDINNITAQYKIALYNESDLHSLKAGSLTALVLKKHSMSFTVKGKFELKRAQLSVKITKKDEVKFEKILKPAQFKAEFDGTRTTIFVDLQALGCPKLGGIFNRKHTVDLKLKLDFSDLGEMVGTKGNEVSASLKEQVEID